jgi:hypothetical protein
MLAKADLADAFDTCVEIDIASAKEMLRMSQAELEAFIKSH